MPDIIQTKHYLSIEDQKATLKLMSPVNLHTSASSIFEIRNILHRYNQDGIGSIKILVKLVKEERADDHTTNQLYNIQLLIFDANAKDMESYMPENLHDKYQNNPDLRDALNYIAIEKTLNANNPNRDDQSILMFNVLQFRSNKNIFMQSCTQNDSDLLSRVRRISEFVDIINANNAYNMLPDEFVCQPLEHYLFGALNHYPKIPTLAPEQQEILNISGEFHTNNSYNVQQILNTMNRLYRVSVYMQNLMDQNDEVSSAFLSCVLKVPEVHLSIGQNSIPHRNVIQEDGIKFVQNNSDISLSLDACAAIFRDTIEKIEKPVQKEETPVQEEKLTTVKQTIDERNSASQNRYQRKTVLKHLQEIGYVVVCILSLGIVPAVRYLLGKCFPVHIINMETTTS